MPLVILLPLIILILVGMSAATGYALRSRSSRLPLERATPELLVEPLVEDPSEDVAPDDVEERGPPIPTFIDPLTGKDMALNDLMFLRLQAHYGTGTTHNLNDLLARFRAEHGG